MGNKLPTLIEPESLDILLREPGFDNKNRIIEVHFGTNTRPDYETSHIKNAQFFDTYSCFEPTKLFPRNWPEPNKFSEYLSSLGISNKHNVIIYDRSEYGFSFSSRVWLHLRAFGNERVSILNGGIKAWQNKNFQLTSEIKNFPRAEFKIKENKTLVKNYDDIVKCLNVGSTQLIDVRPVEEYNKGHPVLGESHLPSSKNFPFSHLFDENTVFKNAEINLNEPVIFYCNTSMSASIVTFAAFIIGHAKIPVYRGSWIEYSQRKEQEKNFSNIKRSTQFDQKWPSSGSKF
ncbi:3-mercaptopyruvate sulfurtransferase [Brachionus plicatilis]|uniref:3-mercaptopyruvate sulfurtransferase n=1 Tax=Brachionus plicatilis TaxID=10195 RepID=A0A3M7P8B0_BRAPC|nr:3-mercaptopyruvate sulfurtransferase [Brachionus plicatilis]